MREEEEKVPKKEPSCYKRSQMSDEDDRCQALDLRCPSSDVRIERDEQDQGLDHLWNPESEDNVMVDKPRCTGIHWNPALCGPHLTPS